MQDADRFRLLGKYRTPRVRVGRWVRCLIRGEVEVAGLHDAPIPWPVCKTGRRHAIIVYGDLVRAVRRESELAVMHWWGVGQDTVWKWRKALGVGATTRGTSRLRSEYTSEPWAVEAWANRYAGPGKRSGGRRSRRRRRASLAPGTSSRRCATPGWDGTTRKRRGGK